MIKLFPKNLYYPKNCLDTYKTQEMYNKAVDVCLPLSKFVPE